MNEELLNGLKTAYIDGSVVSDSAFRPQFLSNDVISKRKVLTVIEEELRRCDFFQISVAFITEGGLEPLLSVLKELENNGIRGEVLTTNYLNFSEPKAIEKLHSLSNITIKMFDVDNAKIGFHTKGYIFKKGDIYRIIVGSSNMTQTALTTNKEWNTKIVSTENGEVATEIVEEFTRLWNSPYSLEYDAFIDNYKTAYTISKKQREISKAAEIPSIVKYRLKPNKMQVAFEQNLKRLIDNGADRALLISATGTGKTYASAFAMRDLGFNKVLFLVHRELLTIQTEKAYSNVFGDTVSMGIIRGKDSIDDNKDKDYVFAMKDTLAREENLKRFDPKAYQAIVLDEAHHSPADTYQRIMEYFKPELWLGMTATPDKRDDDIEGRNVYELFNYNIAYEIRLQQAMEEDLLCPFHYFGLTDLSLVGDGKNDVKRDFSMLTSDERVRHIVEQATYYGYSGDRVKGLVFCSSIAESEELSKKFNNVINPNTGRRFRTIALNSSDSCGNNSKESREKVFKRLAIDEDTEEVKNGLLEPLDYIFSVNILNEGVDIVEINQVIMLRPTQSPIVFIQQLGRGLRKASGKEFVVILDFIGNYDNNYMIPIALSGDRSYKKSSMKKYIVSGNNVLPGQSTIHFDEIAREKVFSSIDRIKGLKKIIAESYVTLKNRLGRVPYMIDFYESGEVDPLIIVSEYKTYQALLEKMENDTYIGKITEDEKLILEYLSKTILNGVRPTELEMLKAVIADGTINFDLLKTRIFEEYGREIRPDEYSNAAKILNGRFTKDATEDQKFKPVEIVIEGQHVDVNYNSESAMFSRMASFALKMNNREFHRQLSDIVAVGIARYKEIYSAGVTDEEPFALWERYTRRDVCYLMNNPKDISSTMYGMKRFGDEAFLFVTYNKESANDKEYLDGKPDYADTFEDNMYFKWDSQIGRGVDSSYVEEVVTAKKRHLLIKKSDKENGFYYLGTFDIKEVRAAKKKNNKGREQDITKMLFKMHNPVRDDFLLYLQSNTAEERESV